MRAPAMQGGLPGKTALKSEPQQTRARSGGGRTLCVRGRARRLGGQATVRDLVKTGNAGTFLLQTYYVVRAITTRFDHLKGLLLADLCQVQFFGEACKEGVRTDL